MFRLLLKEARKGELVERNAKLLTRKRMKREDLLKNLFVLNILLEELRIRTKGRLKENRKIRKLLKLPNTVHNKTSLKNYLNSTRQSASN